MTRDEMMNLINRSLFATIGYADEMGRQNVRRVFCVWHKGMGRHLISTNTSSSHVQSLLKNGNACLYPHRANTSPFFRQNNYTSRRPAVQKKEKYEYIVNNIFAFIIK